MVSRGQHLTLILYIKNATVFLKVSNLPPLLFCHEINNRTATCGASAGRSQGNHVLCT